MKKLLYCPNCGLVYVEGTTLCVTPQCQGTDEWCGPSLQPIDELAHTEEDARDPSQA